MSQPTIEYYLKPSGVQVHPNSSSSKRKEREETTPPDKWKQSKKFIANPKPTQRDFRTPTSNQFEGLPVDEPVLESFIKASKKKVAGNTPPIVIEVTGNWTHQNVKEVLEKYVKDYHIQHRGHQIMRVQVYSPKIHQDLREGLLKEKVAFHTFTRKDEKLPKAVIKGLPKFLHESLPKELEDLGFPDVTVTEVKTRFPSECPPLLAQLPNGTNMSKFKQIRYLSNCLVTVERYKPTKKAGTQCFRCQGFGHASRNCNRPPRCVKCAQDHPTWECPKQDRNEPAKCCNCDKEHPANYSQCQERVKYLERIKTKREALRNAVIQSNPRLALREQKTWAQVTATSKPTINNSQGGTTAHGPSKAKTQINGSQQESVTDKPLNPRIAGTNESLSLDFETTEMLEILRSIQLLKDDFKKCKTFLDKVALILTHLGHYV